MLAVAPRPAPTPRRADTSHTHFLAQCAALLAESHVVARAGHVRRGNGTGATGVVRPGSVEEVAQVVRLAGAHGVPLYPISTGKNWGFGGALPVRAGCVLLDLGRMNRIVHVDLEHGYAVVEPGVTQGQLARHLLDVDAPYFLDVTGAGGETSIIGNALERGIAYNSQRCDIVSDMELVLGDGSVVQTGFSRVEGAQVAHLYAHGIGPALHALVFQSNLAVVTRATIRLVPKPRAFASFVMSVRAEQLGPFMDAMRRVLREGVIQGIPHVANAQRTRESLGPAVARELALARGRPVSRAEVEAAMDRHLGGEWTAVGGLRGDPAMVRTAKRIVGRRLRGLARVRWTSPRTMRILEQACRWLGLRESHAVLRALRPFQRIPHGVPTDEALGCVGWAAGETQPHRDPERSGGDLLFVVPLAPLSGAHAEAMVELARREAEAHGFQAAITLNALDARVLEGVISVGFRRDDPRDGACARQCQAAMLRALSQRGYEPYRVGVEQMGHVVRDDPFWHTVERIKGALDPSRVLAPGRYGP